MKTPKIIVHTLVRNEERFIWYALQSVLPFVDKIMVWDTGSTDKTVEIIKTIKSPKISFKEVGVVDADGLTTMRQKMIEEIPDVFDWLMYLDGDEVWTSSYIKTITNYARSHLETETIVIRTHNLVGDIYHALPESAGRYELAGHKGHLNLRFINLKKVPGLHVSHPHGQQRYLDIDNTPIQNRDQRNVAYLPIFFHHATHLIRSLDRTHDLLVPKRKQKLKHEIGTRIPSTDIPEVFFAKRPITVPDVTGQASLLFWTISALETIPRRIKRLLFPNKSGY